MSKTVILSPRFSSDSQDIWSATIRNNWNVHRAIRFLPPESKDVCVYGELSFCDIMAERCGLALLDAPDTFLLAIPEYTKRNVWVYTASSIKHIKNRFFFKPANDKVFHRGVYEKGTDVPLRHVDPNCPVIISEVVDFSTETRLYCLDSNVVTAANYIFIDGDNQDEEKEIGEAVEFGNHVLHRCGHLLPSSVVLDVGRLSDSREWAVIEANQSYASGIYTGANVDKILDVVYRSSGPLQSVRDDDRKFIRK